MLLGLQEFCIESKCHPKLVQEQILQLELPPGRALLDCRTAKIDRNVGHL
jgi:hypothetical protein